MRKEVVQGFVRSSRLISLENDLPFSMSSESDKEVLLFPLSSDHESNDHLETNIATIIDNVIEKNKREEERCLREVDMVSFENGVNEMVVNDKMMNRVLDKVQNINEIVPVKIETKMVEESCSQYSESQSVYNPTCMDQRINIPIGNGKKRGPYKKFSQQEKENLVTEAKKFGLNQVIRKKSIARKTLCRWISDGVVRKYGGGRQVGDLAMEEKLIHIIKNHFAQCNEIMAKPKIQELAIKLSSNELFTASHGWFQKFYMRHRLEFQRMIGLAPSLVIVKEEPIVKIQN